MALLLLEPQLRRLESKEVIGNRQRGFPKGKVAIPGNFGNHLWVGLQRWWMGAERVTWSAWACAKCLTPSRTTSFSLSQRAMDWMDGLDGLDGWIKWMDGWSTLWIKQMSCSGAFQPSPVFIFVVLWCWANAGNVFPKRFLHKPAWAGGSEKSG